MEADSGTSWIEADLLCERWDVQNFQVCLSVFRNPEGTKEDKNEYFAIYDTGIYPWSRTERIQRQRLPLWVNYGLSRPTAARFALGGKADQISGKADIAI